MNSVLAILDQRLTDGRSGGMIETRLATSAVVVTGKSVNHILHLLVRVPVWLVDPRLVVHRL